MVIEIRRARSDRNAAKLYGSPYFIFYLEEIFCAHDTISPDWQKVLNIGDSKRCNRSSSSATDRHNRARS